jgi:replicative DNA helicase
MTPNLKTVYGLIMLSNEIDSQDLYSKINPEWNLTQFYERLYEAFGSILAQGKVVDPIEVINYFRLKGWGDKKLPLQISNLTGAIQVGSQMYLTSILSEIEYAYQIHKAKNVAARIQNLIDSDNYTEEKYTEILTSGSIKRTELKTTESNVNTIFKIVEDHHRAKSGDLPGFTMPWRAISKEIILESVDVMIVGARPAMGKTAFAVSFIVNMAMKRGLKIAFFSLEMSRKQIMRRIIANISTIDSNRIKFGECSQSEIDRIYKIQESEDLNNIHIFEGSHSIKDITQKISELKRTQGVDIIVIDYLQKILPKSKGSRYEQVTEVSNGVKMIAQNMHVPVIALAQLSRAGAQVGKLPTLTDLKESGEIEQDASIVTFLHRPEYYGEEMTSNGSNSENICEFLIAKNREGSVGKFELGVDLSTSKFYDNHL